MAQVGTLESFGYLHFNIGSLHAAAGRYGAALRCFREAVLWHRGEAADAIQTVAQAAHRAATAAYHAGNLAEAILRCHEARDAAGPDDPQVGVLTRAVATHVHNRGADAFNRHAWIEAAESLAAAVDLDPELAAARGPLAQALRGAASEYFAAGRTHEALAAVDRLRALGTTEEDAGLIKLVEAWLRDGIKLQVRELKVGGAVFLLQQLALLAPATLRTDIDIIQAIGELTRTLAQHAAERQVEVLEAVAALSPIAPSAQLSFAGASAYTTAITEAKKLHAAGALMEAVALCGAAMRYRLPVRDRQLPHALATLLCRRVQDLLDAENQAEALPLHARTLSFLEAYRSAISQP